MLGSAQHERLAKLQCYALTNSECWGMAKRLTLRIAVHIGAIKLGYFQGESRAIVDPPSTLQHVATGAIPMAKWLQVLYGVCPAK